MIDNETLKELSEIARSCKTIVPRYIPPRNEWGYPQWTFDGWSAIEWTRNTNIGDEMESGYMRMEGPTQREAELFCRIVNSFPVLVEALNKITESDR